MFDAGSFSTASFSPASWKINTIAIARGVPIVQVGARAGEYQETTRSDAGQYAVRAVGVFGMRQANVQRRER